MDMIGHWDCSNTSISHEKADVQSVKYRHLLPHWPRQRCPVGFHARPFSIFKPMRRLQTPQQSTIQRRTTRRHLNTSRTERQPPPYRTRTSSLNPTLHRDSTIATRTDRRCAILDDPRGPGRPGRLAQCRRRRVWHGTGRQRRRRSRPAGNRRASARRRPTWRGRAVLGCAWCAGGG